MPRSPSCQRESALEATMRAARELELRLGRRARAHRARTRSSGTSQRGGVARTSFIRGVVELVAILCPSPGVIHRGIRVASRARRVARYGSMTARWPRCARAPRWLRAFLLACTPVRAGSCSSGTARSGTTAPFLWFVACVWLAGGLSRPAERVLVGLLAYSCSRGLRCWPLTSRVRSRRPATPRVGRANPRTQTLYSSAAGTMPSSRSPAERVVRSTIRQRRFGTFMDGARRVWRSAETGSSRTAPTWCAASAPGAVGPNGPPGDLALSAERQLRPGIASCYVARFDGANRRGRELSRVRHRAGSRRPPAPRSEWPEPEQEGREGAHTNFTVRGGRRPHAARRRPTSIRHDVLAGS